MHSLCGRVCVLTGDFTFTYGHLISNGVCFLRKTSPGVQFCWVVEARSLGPFVWPNLPHECEPCRGFDVRGVNGKFCTSTVHNCKFSVLNWTSPSRTQFLQLQLVVCNWSNSSASFGWWHFLFSRTKLLSESKLGQHKK